MEAGKVAIVGAEKILNLNHQDRQKRLIQNCRVTFSKSHLRLDGAYAVFNL
jgi:hypothetical protein